MYVCIYIYVFKGHSAHDDKSETSRKNFVLTEFESRTGDYWPEVMAAWTEHSEILTKRTEGQYSPVEQARIVRSL